MHTDSSTTTATTSTTGFRTEWLWHAFPILGLAALTFFIGMVVAIRQSPPFYTVRDAWIAYCALSEQHNLLSAQWPAHLWTTAASNKRGLVQSQTDQSFGDYTVYSSADGCRATLVDQAGNEVHRWEAPFRSVFPNAQHAPAWLPDQFILLRSALPFANGDLLALYETTANTPSGCGLAKLDLHGRVLWTYDAYTHHDVCVGDNGKIFVLTNKLLRVEGNPQLESLSTVPIVEDGIAILSSEGEELKTISLLDALIESPYYRPLLTHVDSYGDITHNNTVNTVSAEFAAKHAGVSAGDLMVCLRNLNLVAVVNPESEKIVWATTGPWNHPHEPQPLANGNILIFDNFLAQGTRYGSGIVEFNPVARKIAWTYSGEPQLQSDTRGAVELLPNGNALITETDGGRVLEVNRGGETVWEYLHPYRGGNNQELIPVVCGARRFTSEQLPFAKTLRRQDSTLARHETP